MKLQDIDGLRKKGIEDLEKVLSDKKGELLKTKIEIKVSKEGNLKKAKMLKRDIAQINTVIREKEITKKVKDANAVGTQKPAESAEKKTDKKSGSKNGKSRKKVRAATRSKSKRAKK